MGGSALPGRLLKMLFSELSIETPIFIHNDYNLPAQADKTSLLVAISYSGNTEETLSAVKAAVEIN